MTGLSRGGQQIQKSRETYIKAVDALVQLASLQVSFFFLFSGECEDDRREWKE